MDDMANLVAQIGYEAIEQRKQADWLRSERARLEEEIKKLHACIGELTERQSQSRSADCSLPSEAEQRGMQWHENA